jgi:hypothetical protein
MAEAPKDLPLQELIVRALTGMDARARQSLDAASATDPQLRQFCAELDEVVALLVGSKDWRSEKPSAELTEKIRSAVASKLPSAPPHFRTVMLENDLGRRKTILGLVIVIAIGLALLVLAVGYIGFPRGGSDPALSLNHNVTYTSTLKDQKLAGWEVVGDGAWEPGKDGLKAGGSEDAGAIYLQSGYQADHALAFQIDVGLPGLDERSKAIVFLAEAGASGQPVFTPAVQPAQALTLEITRDGLFASGPDHQLLQSRPVSNVDSHFYQIRLEHLGNRVRVLVNGEIFFDGPASRPLRGEIHPGVRLAGPQKKDVRFNAARVER